MATMDESILKAIKTQDAKLAGRIVDRFRNVGATYRDVFARVQKVSPETSEADWDALLEDAD